MKSFIDELSALSSRMEKSLSSPMNKHGTQKVYILILQEAELPLSKVPSNLLHLIQWICRQAEKNCYEKLVSKTNKKLIFITKLNATHNHYLNHILLRQKSIILRQEKQAC